MKNLFASIVCVLAMSSFAENQKSEVFANKNEIILLVEDFVQDDCGGCIAYADSRDDGSDRTLERWNRDLENCRSNSSECAELSEG
jgi:hypothetical protein